MIRDAYKTLDKKKLAWFFQDEEKNFVKKSLDKKLKTLKKSFS